MHRPTSPVGTVWRTWAGSPADLDGIPPGGPVALHGLGLNFFDNPALLTEGPGGTFKERDGSRVPPER